jgi:hypothetical protein
MTAQTTTTLARLVGGLSLGALVALTGCKSSGDTESSDSPDAEPAASQPTEGGGEASCSGSDGSCGGNGSCGGK